MPHKLYNSFIRHDKLGIIFLNASHTWKIFFQIFHHFIGHMLKNEKIFYDVYNT